MCLFINPHWHWKFVLKFCVINKHFDNGYSVGRYDESLRFFLVKMRYIQYNLLSFTNENRTGITLWIFISLLYSYCNCWYTRETAENLCGNIAHCFRFSLNNQWIYIITMVMLSSVIVEISNHILRFSLPAGFTIIHCTKETKDKTLDNKSLMAFRVCNFLYQYLEKKGAATNVASLWCWCGIEEIYKWLTVKDCFVGINYPEVNKKWFCDKLKKKRNFPYCWCDIQK